MSLWNFRQASLGCPVDHHPEEDGNGGLVETDNKEYAQYHKQNFHYDAESYSSCGTFLIQLEQTIIEKNAERDENWQYVSEININGKSIAHIGHARC